MFIHILREMSSNQRKRTNERTSVRTNNQSGMNRKANIWIDIFLCLNGVQRTGFCIQIHCEHELANSLTQRHTFARIHLQRRIPTQFGTENANGRLVLISSILWRLLDVCTHCAHEFSPIITRKIRIFHIIDVDYQQFGPGSFMNHNGGFAAESGQF